MTWFGIKNNQDLLFNSGKNSNFLPLIAQRLHSAYSLPFSKFNADFSDKTFWCFVFLPIKHCRVSPTSFSSTLPVSDGNSCIKPKSSHWQQTEQNLHPDFSPDKQLTGLSQPAWPQFSVTNTIAGTHLILSKCCFMLIFSFNVHMLAETDGTGFSCNYYESRVTTPKSALEWKDTMQICKHGVTAWRLKYRNTTLRKEKLKLIQDFLVRLHHMKESHTT